MVLASFFAFFRGESKPKTNNTSSPKRQTQAPRSGWADYNYGRTQDATSNVTALPTAPKNTYYAPDGGRHPRSERSERRKSRVPTAAQSTSQQNKKNNNRRSWFGGRADPEEDVPAVPRMVQHNENLTDQDLGPGTAITTNMTEVGDNRRHSIARSLHRTKSWFKSQEPSVTVEALPPMPVTVAQPAKAATSTLPADQRRRRNSVKTIERRGSVASTVRPKSKRHSFWASSNPDDSDSDVPPVPALVRDHSPTSSSNASINNVDNTTEKRATRQARPLSTVSTASRKSYTPRAAAKGFLKSTNGASDEQRKSFRKSFSLEDDADLVCLTDEQRIEWVKLMNEREKFEARQQPEPARTDEEKASDRYSNAQALAALEFGVR